MVLALLPAKVKRELPFYPETIPNGVRIAGINVSRMTREEALDILNVNLPDHFRNRDMVVALLNTKHPLSPKDTGVHWDVEQAVDKAFAASQPVDLTVELAVNEDYIREQLRQYGEALGGVYAPSGFWLEGNVPSYTDPEEPTQTLVLYAGASGVNLNLDQIYSDIIDGYKNGNFLVSVEEIGPVTDPKPLNLDTVAQAVCFDPVDPVLDKQTMTVVPGKLGADFDKATAKTLLANGDRTVRLPMVYVQPTKTETDAWFEDTLGACRTPHSDNPERTENLILACSFLDGMVLEPGDTLSYNQTIGQRTTERGFRPAPAYNGTELEDQVGGGICQVSSTLYLASLFAELKVLERVNHGYPVDYIPLGLDAAVNWGTPDLKIQNNKAYAVRLEAYVEDGYVTVRILGADTRDYTVKMEYTVDDPEYASAYLCRYDADGNQISRQLHHTSIYLEEVWSQGGYAESEP